MISVHHQNDHRGSNLYFVKASFCAKFDFEKLDQS